MWFRKELWPGLAEVALAFVGLVGGYYVLALALGLARQLGLATTAPFVVLCTGPAITFAAAAIYAVLGRMWTDTRVATGLARPIPQLPVARPGTTLAIVALSSAAAIVGSMVLGVLLDWIGAGVEEQSNVLEITNAAREGRDVMPAIALSVSALLLAPAAEELLFRALLFRRVLANASRWLAYLLSAAAFAAIHNNPAGIVVYLWLGLCFAHAYERTGRVSAAVLVHIANNALVLATLLWSP
jgi:membrane protease YdiL (CAAX protease family)